MGTTYVKNEVSLLIKILNEHFDQMKPGIAWSDNKTINEVIKFYLIKQPDLLKKVKSMGGVLITKYLKEQKVCLS